MFGSCVRDTGRGEQNQGVRGRLEVHMMQPVCNGHYNRSPDLGKCVMWWNTWDLARYTILDTKVLDRTVTRLTKHKDTS